jgi:hypothetical protein
LPVKVGEEIKVIVISFKGRLGRERRTRIG